MKPIAVNVNLKNLIYKQNPSSLVSLPPTISITMENFYFP